MKRKSIFVLILSVFLLVLLPLFASNGKDKEAKATATEKIADVYFISGQSNASGTTWINTANRPETSEGASYDATDADLVYNNVLYSGISGQNLDGSIGFPIYEFVPTRQGMGCNSLHIGPELGMAEYLDPIYAEIPNTDAVIIKAATGGTDLLHFYNKLDENGTFSGSFNTYGSWYPESLWNVRDQDGNKVDLWQPQYFRERTGHLYRSAITFFKEQIQLLRDMGYTKINLKAFTWMQGEADRYDPDKYAQVFTVFCNDLRAQLASYMGDDKYLTLPIVVGEISRTFGSYDNLAMNLRFIEMQDGLPGTVKNLYVAPSGQFDMHDQANTSLGSDSYHWSYENEIKLGKMFGELSYTAKANPRWLFVKTVGSTNIRMGEIPTGKVDFCGNNIDEETEEDFSVTVDNDKFVLKGVYATVNNVKGANLIDDYDFDLKDGNKIYTSKYTLPTGTDDVTVEFVFGDAKRGKVTVTTAGEEFGGKITSLGYDQFVYEIVDYKIKVSPNEGCEVASVKIGDTEVPFEVKNQTLIIKNVEKYATLTEGGNDKVNVTVTYQKIKEEKKTGGCAQKAMQTLIMVGALCSLVFVIRKLIC